MKAYLLAVALVGGFISFLIWSHNRPEAIAQREAEGALAGAVECHPVGHKPWQ